MSVSLLFDTGHEIEVPVELMERAEIELQGSEIDFGNLSPELVLKYLNYAAGDTKFNLDQEAKKFQHLPTIEGALSAIKGLVAELKTLLNITRRSKALKLGLDLDKQMLKEFITWTSKLNLSNSTQIETTLSNQPVLTYLVYELLSKNYEIFRIARTLETILFPANIDYSHIPIKLVILVPLIAIHLLDTSFSQVAFEFLDHQNHEQGLYPVSGQQRKEIQKLSPEYMWLIKQIHELGYSKFYRVLDGLSIYFNQYNK